MKMEDNDTLTVMGDITSKLRPQKTFILLAFNLPAFQVVILVLLHHHPFPSLSTGSLLQSFAKEAKSQDAKGCLENGDQRAGGFGELRRAAEDTEEEVRTTFTRMRRRKYKSIRNYVGNDTRNLHK